MTRFLQTPHFFCFDAEHKKQSNINEWGDGKQFGLNKILVSSLTVNKKET